MVGTSRQAINANLRNGFLKLENLISVTPPNNLCSLLSAIPITIRNECAKLVVFQYFYKPGSGEQLHGHTLINLGQFLYIRVPFFN